MKGQSVFGQENVYYVEYDRVDGLLVSNPVQINGYQIGVIDDIYLKENNTNKIIVKFSVDDDVNLYRSDSAEIVSTSLLGDKALEIKLQEVGKRSTVRLGAGDTVPGLVEVDVFEYAENELMPIKVKVERLLTQLDTTVGSVNRIMNSNQMKSTMGDVSKSVATVEGTLKDLDKLVNQIGGLAGDVGDITKNLNGLIEKEFSEISGIIENVDGLSAELAKNTKELNSIMTNAENFTRKLNDVDLKSPVDQLNSTIGEVKGLSQNANKLVTNLNTTIDETGTVIDDVGKTIKEVSGTVEKVSGTVAEVGGSVSDLSTNLQTTSTTADSTMRDLTETVNEVNNLLVKINQGEGSAGQLVTDKALYNNLAGVSDNLNKLLIDLKSNPKDYVGISIFGGKRYEERMKRKEERRKAKGK